MYISCVSVGVSRFNRKSLHVRRAEHCTEYRASIVVPLAPSRNLTGPHHYLRLDIYSAFAAGEEEYT